MDEAERCHALAILADGRLVAAGSPRDLEARIGAIVLEVETEEMRAARAALAGMQGLWSVAQLGTRLHALIDPAIADPAGAVRAALSHSGVDARVECPGAGELVVEFQRDVRAEGGDGVGPEAERGKEAVRTRPRARQDCLPRRQSTAPPSGQ